MRILNYGAGAVGLGIDSCLLKAGQAVDIIARPDTVSFLRSHGLFRTGLFGDFHAAPHTFSCHTSLNELVSQPYDFILVSTKSFDSSNAAQDIARHSSIFNKKTKIVLCQNGWGNAEIFASHFPKKQIYNARIITGFCRPKPNEATITVHADSICIGSLFHSDLKVLEPLCQSITQGGIPCVISPDIAKDLWAKMLYNCALNPLGTILDVPYGVLGEYKYSRLLMEEIIEEVIEVMKAAGFKTHWPSAQDYLKIFYSDQLPSTAQHRSSTLQDIQARKPTEINALNGMVVQLARQFKIKTPVNQSVYYMVKFLEEKNMRKSHD